MTLPRARLPSWLLFRTPSSPLNRCPPVCWPDVHLAMIIDRSLSHFVTLKEDCKPDARAGPPRLPDVARGNNTRLKEKKKQKREYQQEKNKLAEWAMHNRVGRSWLRRLSVILVTNRFDGRTIRNSMLYSLEWVRDSFPECFEKASVHSSSSSFRASPGCCDNPSSHRSPPGPSCAPRFSRQQTRDRQE